MLLQNTIASSQIPVRFRGGATLAERPQWSNAVGIGNIHTHYVTSALTTSIPSGNTHPASWLLPQKGGNMASFTGLRMTGTVTGTMYMGIPNVGSFTGVGTFNATGSLVIFGSGSFTGTGTFSATAQGNLFGSGSFTGVADFSASMSGSSGLMAASFTGTGSFSATLGANGEMHGDFTVPTDLSSLIADKVDELWTIHGLDSSNPLTVTSLARSAGTVSQTISGTTTVTVTRT